MTSHTVDHKSSFKKKTIIATTIAALAIGTAGIGALDTLHTMIENNTATVHGSDTTAPHLVPTGNRLEILYSADGKVTGDKRRAWSFKNDGDAPARWDGIFVPDERTDSRVAAATRVDAYIIPWATDENGERGFIGVHLDLGTLATPISLRDAWEAWASKDQTVEVKIANRTLTFPRRELASSVSESIAPGASSTFTMELIFDTAEAAAVSATVNEGELRVAAASFDVAYVKG